MMAPEAREFRTLNDGTGSLAANPEATEGQPNEQHGPCGWLGNDFDIEVAVAGEIEKGANVIVIGLGAAEGEADAATILDDELALGIFHGGEAQVLAPAETVDQGVIARGKNLVGADEIQRQQGIAELNAGTVNVEGVAVGIGGVEKEGEIGVGNGIGRNGGGRTGKGQGVRSVRDITAADLNLGPWTGDRANVEATGVADAGASVSGTRGDEQGTGAGG